MPRDRLRITEIFFSIQGESARAGRPCVFVRLTGCHLRCHYCDTEYAFREGRMLTLDEIVEQVISHPAELVEITGGEPLLQTPVHDLMRRLCDLGKTVLLETSGACDIGGCDPRVIRILDLKTPGSGEADRNLLDNLAHVTPRDEVKFVITDREDYEWAKVMIERHQLADRVREVLLSPVHPQPRGAEVDGAAGLAPGDLAAWILADGLPVRLQLQLHKLVWAPDMRGV